MDTSNPDTPNPGAAGFGRLGIWVNRTGWDGEGGDKRFAELAVRLEELGYGTLWSSGGFADAVPEPFAAALAATSRMTVATGVVSVWHVSAQDAGRFVDSLPATSRERFVLGLGASHASNVEDLGVDYSRPYSKVAGYLDDLDALGDLHDGDSPVPPDRRVLAALGPRMLRLAGQRSAGAHPYFVPPEHTAEARQLLGGGPLLAPEQAVVLDADPSSARATARQHLERYLQLPNYTSNLRRFGFSDDDFADGGSNRVVDAVVAWGDLETVAGRVRAHWAAGADHVALQVLPAGLGRALGDRVERLAEGLLT